MTDLYLNKDEKIFNHLENLHKKYNGITTQLSDPEVIKNQIQFRQLSKELANLKPLEKKYQEFEKLITQYNDAEELHKSTEDQDLKELANEEIQILSENIEKLKNDIKILMVSDQSDDNRNVFLEIRAGAGGNEASLFASDLLRMYTRISESKNWKSEIISTTYSTIGGIKEIILHIKGNNVNKYLKYESGVHRVQRVPVTEASGRIHTSTVTVAIMPEVDDIEVEMSPKDIRIDTFSASGPGGQHVNRTQSAIRISHLPSGIVVSCQDEKSQHKNKERAMKVLKARLYEFEKTRQNNNIANDRKSQVGSGDRSEKIRTYNFPQSRVTDHRINGKNFNIESILTGYTDDLIKELTDIHTKKLLEEKLEAIIS